MTHSLEQIKQSINHTTLQVEQHTRIRRQAKNVLDKYCRVGSPLGTLDAEICCFKKPGKCEIITKPEPCNDQSTQLFSGKSNIGCQLAYSAVVIMKNGRTIVDVNITTATRRCSMSCLHTKSLISILQTQTPEVACVCGFQGLQFKMEEASGSVSDDNKGVDLQIYGNRSLLTGTIGNYTFANIVDFSRYCSRAGTVK